MSFSTGLVGNFRKSVKLSLVKQTQLNYVVLSYSQVCTQTFLQPKATLIVFVRDTSKANELKLL